MGKVNFTFAPRLHWLSKLSLAVFFMAFCSLTTVSAQFGIVLDAPDATYTIPSCEDEVLAFYSVTVGDQALAADVPFTVTGDINVVFDVTVGGDAAQAQAWATALSNNDDTEDATFEAWVRQPLSAGQYQFTVTYTRTTTIPTPFGPLVITDDASDIVVINVEQGSDIERAVVATDLVTVIPACDDEFPAPPIGFSAYDCNGTPDAADFTVTGNGVYAGATLTVFPDLGTNQFLIGGIDALVESDGFVDFLTITYLPGTPEEVVAVLGITAVDQDEPAVVVAPSFNATVPTCDDVVEAAYSWSVFDCNGVDPDLVNVLVEGVPFPSNTGIASVDDFVNNFDAVVSGGGNVLTVTHRGQLPSTAGLLPDGDLDLTFIYGDVAIPATFVVDETANRPPVINLPGNNTFTVPFCDDQITASFSIQISDDCDDTFAPIFTLGGAPIFPSFSDGAGYFEFIETLTTANTGDLLAVTVTDSDGATTFNDAVIIVNKDGVSDLGPIACVPINITLNDMCMFNLTVQNVGNAQGISCAPDNIRVIVNDWNVDPNAQNKIDGAGTFDYGIFNSNTNEIICWGTVNAEDKTAPVIEEPADQAVECWLIGDVLNVASTVDGGLTPVLTDGELGSPIVTDACEGELGYTFADAIEYYNCSTDLVEKNGVVVGRLYAKITRRFTARDSKGNTSTEIQVIEFFEPNVGDFQFVADADNGFVNEGTAMAPKWVQTINDCDADSSNPPAVIYPEYTDCFGNDVDLGDNLCNYSTNVDGRLFDNICGDGYKMERTIKVFDWCAGGVVAPDFSYTVKVGDFEAPEFDDCVLEDGEVVAGNTVDFSGYSLANPNMILADLNGGGTAVDAAVNPADFLNATDFCIKEISTGPMNCTASLNSDLDALRNLFGDDIVTDKCGDLTVTTEVISYGPELVGKFPTGRNRWTIGGYTQQGPMIVGLPQGYHALIISASDNCYNSAIGIVFFKVVDKVKPVMKCDDELRVTLVEGDPYKSGIKGYALVTYEDVDEGSWDNCQLKTLEVRRDITNEASRADWEAKNGDLDEDEDYTPWDDIVEFFCGDIGDPVKVELRGTDKSGNSSICWLNVDVENGLNYTVALEGEEQKISCEDDPITPENAHEYADIVIYGGLCDDLDFELDVIADLDQCGEGYYKIFIKERDADVSKNPISVSEDTVYVKVALVHDYWIKFPADAELDCFEVENYEGVVTSDDEDVACDLLATYTDTPERFDATQNGDACYKLFVTYKVINWCEYDGESLPVIVSRDWDSWNGYDCGDEVGEYNMNPQDPDGDDKPGNTDLYVIVDVNDKDWTGIVYYDSDSDPFSNSGAVSADDPATKDLEETYWWAVDKAGTCAPSTWFDDEDNRDGSTPPDDKDGFDIDGSDAQDDNDNRYGSHGYWQYTQHVLVYDDTAPVVETEVVVANGGSLDNDPCDAEVTINITVTDDCSVEDLVIQIFDSVAGLAATLKGDDITVDGNTATASWTAPAGLVLGTYKWTVEANDGCGNVGEAEEEFEVEDIKDPAPICHDGLAVELMPTEVAGEGMAAIWAYDFIASDINDCTGQGDDVTLGGVTAPQIVKEAYSIYRNEGFADSLYQSPITNEGVRGLTLDCDDFAAGMVMVRVYAEDEEGNADYCLTFIEVQNNNGACGDPAPGQIAGAIATENNATIEGVEVQLSGARSMMYMTDVNGNFVFRGLALGGDYTVTPQKDQNHLNGVSTFDLVLISKHILGVQPLDSPYKLIAADVNNSKSVTTLDLIQLRKLILNIDTEFANNTSWRFVDAAHTFDNPSNPWSTAFPEFRNMNNLNDNVAAAQFVGVKVGDVNNSASVETRSATGTLAINTAERTLVAGNEYTVTFDADMKDIAGYQFTLNVDNAEIVDLIPGAAKAENFGVFTQEGAITTSFNGEAAGELFSLVIRATADVNLSEALTVSSRMTAAEAYTNDAEQLNVALNFTGATAAEAAFSLTQNTPNPFQGETVIGFNLPTAGEATLTIQDVAGRTVKMVEGDFTKGYNQVTLNASDLPSAGVFFYTLTAGELSATKKMILVDAVNR